MKRGENGGLSPLKIGFFGGFSGSGTSFLASVLANRVLSLNFNPCVLEFGNSRLYDSLGMDKHFAEGDFFPFQKYILKGRSVQGLTNLYEGINWCLRTPAERGLAPGFREKLRLLQSMQGDLMICDFSGVEMGTSEWEDNWRLLWEMDRIVVVLDPLPSRMLPSAELVARLRGGFLPVEYVINRWNRGVDSRTVLSFFQLADPVLFPFLDPSVIYSAEYGCRFVWDIPDVRCQLAGPSDLLCERLGLA